MECHNPRARLNSTYFRRSRVIIFVYDITNRDSFDSLSHWEDEALQRTLTRNNTVTEILMALVGNKLDLDDERQVTRSRALQFAENFFIPENLVFEVSAKTGGVKQMFDTIGRAMTRKGQKHTRLPKSPPNSTRGGGCKC